ncbi:hypothetical protein TSMEX_005007 [Taenia solium]|eukprot:TsM_000764000 transcript=TsM_000764000 gene=TsM_000764000
MVEATVLLSWQQLFSINHKATGSARRKEEGESVESWDLPSTFVNFRLSRKAYPRRLACTPAIGTMRMKTGISAFARANAFCCQLTSVFCFILALGLIVGGAVLIDKNSGVFYRWTEFCDDVNPGQPNFAIGIAMVFFGCVFVVLASIMMFCACGFLAFSDNSKSIITVTQQPQMVNQLPMGSYSNQPIPPPFVAPSYQPDQPQMPPGCPTGPAPYPICPVYPMPTAVPPSYDQAAETPDPVSMPMEKY